MVYVHLQNWYSSLFLSCKDICLNLVLSRIILAITPCKTSFPAWGLNQILLVRKSFVSKDKENTRYWFFFLYEKSYPQTFELLKVASFKFLPLGYKFCWNAPPKCQMWSSARGLPRKGIVEASKWWALFESFCTVRVIVIASSGLSVWTVTVPLLFLLGWGGVNNWSCCNKLALCQQWNIQNWCIPITAHV